MKRHLLWAAAAALLFGLPLASSLATSIPYRVRQPLTSGDAALLDPVELPELTYLRRPDGQTTYRLRLVSVNPDALLGQPDIELRVADYGQARAIVSAEISIPSANCAYAARRGRRLPNNDVLLFIRQQPCRPIPNATEPEVLLTVRLQDAGRVGVWAAKPAQSSPSGAALLVADRTQGQFSGHALTGAFGYEDASRATTRLALLAYVWQLPSTWLVMMIAGSVVLIGLSASLLSYGYAYPTAGRGRVLQSSLAALSAALALALVYACVVPPFQAPDETHHFAGLTAFLKRPQLSVDGTLLEQRGHHDRLTFHSEEHFNPSDIGHPGIILATGVEPDWDVRGRGIFSVWRAFAPLLLRTHRVSTLLLLARALNGVVFAVAIGLFVGTVAVFGPSKVPALEAFPLFIIPTLPFFGMYLSNYAPLCATYIVLASAVMVLVRDGPLSHVSGPLLGLSWAAATFLSRSAWPVAPVLIGCAMARMILGAPNRSWPGAFVFWMGLSVPAAIALTLLPPELFTAVQAATAAWPQALRLFRDVILFPWIVVLLGFVACIVEMLAHRSKPQGGAVLRTRATGVAAAAAYAAAALVGVSIVVSGFLRYPTSPSFDPQHPPAAAAHVLQLLRAAVTMFRFGQADFLTSQSFWSGFGWLDVPLPGWVIAALTVSTGAALVVTLIWIARTRATRTAVLYVVVFAGLLSAFAATSYMGLRATVGNVHGRYLLGIYVSSVLLCWGWLPRTTPEAPSAAKSATFVACGFAVIAIHGLAFATILSRYFG